ncbi:MAG: HesA/MoeB/ThiF family protein [Pseudomonadota bacterium]
MTAADLERRYGRQIKLPNVGHAGQQALADSRVLIVGIGGLGSPVALYLAAAGIGKLILVDFDRVEESNLQRQIAHHFDDIGALKAESAAAKLRAINPDLQIDTRDYSMDREDFLEVCADVDLIVDCTDNFPSRFDLNDVSVELKIPLVSGAAIRWEGQVTAFNPNVSDSPCYQCLYPDRDIEGVTCAMEGVISPLVGVIGTMQALESVNILLGRDVLCGSVWLFDAERMDWRRIKLPKNPMCPACSD